MTSQDIIRAWKDETYRASLSPEQLVLLPESPVGAADLIDLSDEELDQVGGASVGTCHGVRCITGPSCRMHCIL